MEGRMTTTEPISALPRRHVLCGIMAMGILGTTALTACSEDTPEATAPADNGPGTTPPATDATTNPPAAGGAGIAQVGQIPVGGGMVVSAPDGSKLVIVQPTAGDFKAFNASCTHQGTTVGAPQEGIMTCPNHGSKFSATDGSVKQGPAGSPLKPVAIAVSGDNITLA
jgi:Rieske Fe-S protein